MDVLDHFPAYRRTIEELSIMSHRARGLVMSVSSVTDTAGTELLSELQDILTPEILFHQVVSPWPNIWTELRKFLAQRFVLLFVHERHRAVLTLAINIFADAEEKKLALDKAQLDLSAGNVSSQQQQPQVEDEKRGNRDYYVKEKVAHSVFLHMKDP